MLKPPAPLSSASDLGAGTAAAAAVAAALGGVAGADDDDKEWARTCAQVLDPAAEWTASVHCYDLAAAGRCQPLGRLGLRVKGVSVAQTLDPSSGPSPSLRLQLRIGAHVYSRLLAPDELRLPPAASAPGGPAGGGPAARTVVKASLAVRCGLLWIDLVRIDGSVRVKAVTGLQPAGPAHTLPPPAAVAGRSTGALMDVELFAVAPGESRAGAGPGRRLLFYPGINLGLVNQALAADEALSAGRAVSQALAADPPPPAHRAAPCSAARGKDPRPATQPAAPDPAGPCLCEHVYRYSREVQAQAAPEDGATTRRGQDASAAVELAYVLRLPHDMEEPEVLADESSLAAWGGGLQAGVLRTARRRMPANRALLQPDLVVQREEQALRRRAAAAAPGPGCGCSRSPPPPAATPAASFGGDPLGPHGSGRREDGGMRGSEGGHRALAERLFALSHPGVMPGGPLVLLEGGLGSGRSRVAAGLMRRLQAPDATHHIPLVILHMRLASESYAQALQRVCVEAELRAHGAAWVRLGRGRPPPPPAAGPGPEDWAALDALFDRLAHALVLVQAPSPSPSPSLSFCLSHPGTPLSFPG